MLVVPAYAKVNLALEIIGRRPDGRHDVATVISLVDWHDLVGIAIAPAPRPPSGAAGPHRPRVTLRISGPFAEGIPADEHNLAARAADALLGLAGDPPLHVHLWLCKQVPAAAGLGGGSADAAAVLRACAPLLGVDPTTPAVADAAAGLGSDVPAALAGGTQLATGHGERLQPLPTPPLHLAVAVAGPSSTAAAYAALTDAERCGDGRAARLQAVLSEAAALRDPAPQPGADTPRHPAPQPGADAPRHPAPQPATGATLDPALLGSALEPAACRAAPGLADALRRLRAATPGTPWHLTGSGGAAFALAPDAPAAAALAQAAAAQGFPARACRTVPHRLA